MMDAKTIISIFRSGNEEEKILFGREYILKVADFIEQQEKEFEEAEKSARYWQLEVSKISVQKDREIKILSAIHDGYEDLKTSNKALNLIIAEQEKYAELGRLAVEAVASGGFENCNSIYDKECFEGCTWYKFCQKRAELLAGEK